MSRHLHWIFLLGLVLIAICLRLNYLGERSLGFDEALSLSEAAHSTKRILTETIYEEGKVTYEEENPPLYFLLLHFWLSLGKSEFMARLLSLLFGLASFPLLYRMAKELYDEKTARVAFFLFTFSWLHIRYSQEARPYSLFVLTSLLSFLFFLKAMRSDKPGHWALYAVTTIGALSTHLFALFLPLSQAAIFLLDPRGTRKRPSFFLPSLSVVSVFSALFLFDRLLGSFLRHGASFSQISYLPSVLAGFISGHPSLPLGYFSVPALVLVIVKPIYHVMKQRHFETILLVIILALPLTTLAIVSFFRNFLAVRYVIFLLPFFLILVSRALIELRSPWLRRGTLAMLVLCNGLQLFHYFQGVKNDRTSWKELGFYLESKVKPDDRILVIPAFEKLCVGYYFKKKNEVQGISRVSSSEMDLFRAERLRNSVWVIYDPPAAEVDPKGDFYHSLQRSALKTDFPNLFLLQKNVKND